MMFWMRNIVFVLACDNESLLGGEVSKAWKITIWERNDVLVFVCDIERIDLSLECSNDVKKANVFWHALIRENDRIE